MTTDSSHPWYTGLQKKYAWLIIVSLMVVVFGAAYGVCMLEYQNKKKELLASEEGALAAWVSGTTEAINLWKDALESQAKRVSTSELYRLFATEARQMEGKDVAVLNEPDAAPATSSEDEEMLTEQVPHMRNVLLDFMNYNGLTDARIVNARGQTLLSALSRPTPVTEQQKKAVDRALDTEKMAFAPVRGTQIGLVLDYADPLQPTMTSEVEKPVAALLLTTPVTGQIAQFLARDLHQTGEAVPHLLQQQGDQLEAIRIQSPNPIPLPSLKSLPETSSGSLPFALRPSLNGDTESYSLGKQIPDLGWWVVLEIPASRINDRLASEAWMIFGVGALSSMGIMLLLALLWWIVVGHQQRAIAQRFENLYQVIKQQKQLLDSINVSLDVGLFMADMNGVVQVSNRAFARIVKQEEADLPGRTLASLFEGKVSGQLVDVIRKVIDTGETTSFELALPEGDDERLFRVTLFPFVGTEEEKRSGAVTILQDITEFRRRSELHRRQQLSTISALVRAIESVDPYLAGHSHMMSELAELVSQHMDLSEADRNTVRTAASLSQVGKLFVPRELLSKSGNLTTSEQTELMRVPEYAYNVLRDIDFGLPVSDAIYEMYERMDGSGYPRHLSGQDISVHARILAVVNAFCAMVSPRSYRNGMSIRDAIEQLRSTPEIFDQQIVNKLEEVLKTPEGAQKLTGRGNEAVV